MRWILDTDDETPLLCPNHDAWSLWMAASEVILAKTRIRERVLVITAFIGISLDAGGPPMLWETRVFGSDQHGKETHYASRSDAMEGHRKQCLALVQDEV